MHTLDSDKREGKKIANFRGRHVWLVPNRVPRGAVVTHAHHSLPSVRPSLAAAAPEFTIQMRFPPPPQGGAKWLGR